MKQLLKFIILLLCGGMMYYIVEIMARGHSHWTMFLTGGICFVLVGLLNEITPKMPLLWQMFISMAVITVIEFAVGCVVNIWLGWNVWDYSGRAFNLIGQICLKNSCYWFFLSAVAVFIDDYLRYWLFREDKPKYKIF